MALLDAVWQSFVDLARIMTLGWFLSVLFYFAAGRWRLTIYKWSIIGASPFLHQHSLMIGKWSSHWVEQYIRRLFEAERHCKSQPSPILFCKDKCRSDYKKICIDCNEEWWRIVKLGPRQKVAFQSGGWWLVLAVTQKQTRYANQDSDKGAKLVLLNRCMLIGKLSL